MQEIVNQILDGNFEYEGRSLTISCEKIELSLPVQTDYEGSFRIASPTGRFTTGTVSTSDIRMECLTREFTGCDEEISYCFHGENLEEGDVVKGSFFVVSNQGEYDVPFEISVACETVNSSIGEIKNLFHFANLARSSWQEAVNLFYSPGFIRIFEGSDARFYDVYRALSAYPGQEQNVEEFLIHVNKKQKTEYVIGENGMAAQLEMDLQKADSSCPVYEKEVLLVRNGWGYTKLFVECRGDFLFTEKEVLTDDDFLGTRCSLPVFVDSRMCRRGKNYGCIYLYNSYVSMEIPVMVRVGEKSGVRKADLAMKRILVQMMEYYQAFRLKKITAKIWLRETGKLVERMVAHDEKNVAARLFQAQLLLTRERYHEAEWLLEHAAELMSEEEKNGTLQAYYLYLTTLMSDNEKYIHHAAAQVKQIFRRDSENWRVAWLMLYLSEELNRSASKKWVFIEKQFAYGCTSPVLYIEALALLNNNPALLRKLGGFELQTLLFGAKQKALDPGAVEQLLYLAGRVREFSPVLLKCLQLLYEEQEDVRILREICALLIKGGKAGTKYFEWYRAGVEAQLRITNLYEYFMMSLDLEQRQPIPKAALMYFSYQNHLDYEHSAYLYDYVLQNQEKYAELYSVYRGRIERFVTDRLQKCRINRHLAALYREFLSPEMINPQTASSLARLLFAHQIRVDDSRIQKVFVYQPGNLVPAQYLLSEGTTWIALYGSEYTIVLEDGFGNRFTKNAEYTLEELMGPEEYLNMIVPYVRNCPELDLYLNEGNREAEETPGERAARLMRIAGSDRAALSVRRSCYPKILQYYYDTDNMRGMDEYLVSIPAGELKERERGIVLKYMVLRGLYGPAYDLLKQYGPSFADPKVLMRLISAVMERNRMVEDPVLTAAAVAAFEAGKYDGNILTYLSWYFQGKIGDMYDIWRAAKSYDVDCYRLSERLLLQMLYSGVFPEEKMEIFRYYVSQGAKSEVEEAFLSCCAYNYLVHGEEPEGFVFREIKNMYLRNEDVQKVCRLAYLKFYGKDRQVPDEESAALISVFLEEMAEEGVHLEFLRGYGQCRMLRQEMMDKTIVEYFAHPNSRTVIHYAILHENGEKDEVRSEYMHEVCGGLCFAEFVLFFGERLQYSIVEERDGETEKKTDGILQKSDETREPENSRFRLINDIVISKTLEDYETLDGLLEEYYRREYYNSRLFELT